MYGDNDATTVINNCDRYIYMGGMDLETCRNIAERMNISPSDVLYLPLKKEFVFQRGQRPIQTERWHITENKIWQTLYKPLK